VRHGHLPERSIMTGIGPVMVRQPCAPDDALQRSELAKSDIISHRLVYSITSSAWPSA